jgi:hypothetical protein
MISKDDAWREAYGGKKNTVGNIMNVVCAFSDRLCGLVVRVPDC